MCAIAVAIPSTVNPTRTGSSTISAKLVSGNTTIINGTTLSVSIVTVSKTLKVIVVDKASAIKFWAPVLGTGYGVGSFTPGVLVWGPYLVRDAVLSSNGKVLQLTGDTNAPDTIINVIAPASVQSLSWNNQSISLSTTELGSKRATLPFKYGSLAALPSLGEASWACVDSLPEIQAGFDDSDWVVANKTSTARPAIFQPLAGKVSTVTVFWFEYEFDGILVVSGVCR